MAIFKNTLMLANIQAIVKYPPYNVVRFSCYCWYLFVCLFIFVVALFK